MRDEQEMLNLILSIANKDERVIAVYMNGSRTNVNAPKDIFQDFDIVFVVNNTSSFIDDKTWINKFGEILYMQYPDESPYHLVHNKNFYGWLMQFSDGNRIDLHVESLAHALNHIGDDKLCKILLDKKALFTNINKATDEDYWVKKPTVEEYLYACNEFWWCTNNIAKGLWREELPYVQDMANFHLRKELEKMLSWKIGLLTNFSVSIGKSGKYMNRWLDEDEWALYLSTYFSGDVNEAWLSVFTMCQLFKDTALYVRENLNFHYDILEEKNAMNFLSHTRQLPKDAKVIY